jgi:hypothetical protein
MKPFLFAPSKAPLSPELFGKGLGLGFGFGKSQGRFDLKGDLISGEILNPHDLSGFGFGFGKSQGEILDPPDRQISP